MTKSYSKLFETFRLMSGLTLRNQAVMAPMTTWAGNDDGTVSEDEINYYRCRVKGVGLVITGCTHVRPTASVSRVSSLLMMTGPSQSSQPC